MLPQLRAEESLEAATRVAVGSGTAGEEAREIMRAWNDAADDGRPPRNFQKATPDALAAMGIKVTRVPKQPRVE